MAGFIFAFIRERQSKKAAGRKIGFAFIRERKSQKAAILGRLGFALVREREDQKAAIRGRNTKFEKLI